MMDTISIAINNGIINKENISFNLIRKIAGINKDIWSQLGRGRAILTTNEQLNQYLYSYGPMIKSQWENILREVIFPSGCIEITDYGCGQGLASIIFFDTFKNSNLDNISRINLIEPSFLGVTRAKNILQCYCPKSEIFIINKVINDLLEADFSLSEEVIKIHLFSNILDIEGFDQIKLFNRILSRNGHHYFFAVSHNREHNGGSQRLHAVFNAIKDEKNNFKVLESVIFEFNCDKGQPALAFFIRVWI